jgi:hypothetical protein
VTLRLTTDFEPHSAISDVAVVVDGQPNWFKIPVSPVPAAVTDAAPWLILVTADVSGGAQAGDAFSVDLALMTLAGEAGTYVTWEATVLDGAPLSCPEAADCFGRVCGADPQCGTSCGVCVAGEACGQAGACVGALACPDAAECTGRECGPDPVCGTNCGTCDAGESCQPGGVCGSGDGDGGDGDGDGTSGDGDGDGSSGDGDGDGTGGDGDGATNEVPVAVAPPEAVVAPGAMHTLDGSGSFDPDSGPSTLSYQWTPTNALAMQATLDDPTSSTPSFTVPTVSAADLGEYLRFELVVDDGLDSSAPVEAIVRVTPDEAEYVFVDAVNGSPTGVGTLADPLSTISDGIALAAMGTPPRSVAIAEGDYPEDLIAVVNDVDLYGGFAPGFAQRDRTTYDTRLNPADSNHMIADSTIVDATTISGLHFAVPLDRPTASTHVTLEVVGGTVIVDDCWFDGFVATDPNVTHIKLTEPSGYVRVQESEFDLGHGDTGGHGIHIPSNATGSGSLEVVHNEFRINASAAGTGAGDSGGCCSNAYDLDVYGVYVQYPADNPVYVDGNHFDIRARGYNGLCVGIGDSGDATLIYNNVIELDSECMTGNKGIWRGITQPDVGDGTRIWNNVIVNNNPMTPTCTGFGVGYRCTTGIALENHAGPVGVLVDSNVIAGFETGVEAYRDNAMTQMRNNAFYGNGFDVRGPASGGGCWARAGSDGTWVSDTTGCTASFIPLAAGFALDGPDHAFVSAGTGDYRPRAWGGLVDSAWGSAPDHDADATWLSPALYEVNRPHDDAMASNVEATGFDIGAYERRCGDGVQTSDEACDDGNTDDDDGCSIECMNELSTVRDDFETGSYDAAVWTAFAGGAAVEMANTPVGSFVAALPADAGEIEFAVINALGCDVMRWQYAARRGPDPVTAASSLSLEYWDGAAWIGVESWDGIDTADTSYTTRRGILPTAALGLDLRVRLIAAGGPNTAAYRLDDVALRCLDDV